MRITLSQPDRRPIPTSDHALRRVATSNGIARSLFVLFVVVLGSGCEGSKTGAESSNSVDDAAGGASTGIDRQAYEWPEDPTHPIIRIEVEGAAGPGTIEIELMPELAPVTVAQIVDWADEGYFDGMTFHRVIKDFMIQGGDPNTRDHIPTNDGQGGPGFTLDDEFSDAPFVRGVVGMGNTGRKNSAGSQFFIMQADVPSLDGQYTVIGRVRSGIEMVDAIVGVEIDTVGRWGPRARPIENVVMKSVRRIDSQVAASPR